MICVKLIRKIDLAKLKYFSYNLSDVMLTWQRFFRKVFTKKTKSKKEKNFAAWRYAGEEIGFKDCYGKRRSVREFDEWQNAARRLSDLNKAIQEGRPFPAYKPIYQPETIHKDAHLSVADNVGTDQSLKVE